MVTVETIEIDAFLSEFKGVYTYTLGGLLASGVPLPKAHQIADHVVNEAAAHSSMVGPMGFARGRYLPETEEIEYISHSGNRYFIKDISNTTRSLCFQFRYPGHSSLAEAFSAHDQE